MWERINIHPSLPDTVAEILSNFLHKYGPDGQPYKHHSNYYASLKYSGNATFTLGYDVYDVHDSKKIIVELNDLLYQFFFFYVLLRFPALSVGSLFSVANVMKLAERGYTSLEPRKNLSECVRVCIPIGMIVTERVTA